MALERTQIPISIKDGLDLKADPKQVSPGRFVILENGVFLKTGEIQKCNGFATRTTLNDFFNNDVYTDTGTGCATFKESLFVTGKRFAWSFNPTANKTAKVGEYIPTTITRSNAINQDANTPSVVYNPTTNVLVYAWSEADNVNPTYPDQVKFTVIDRNTGAVVIPERFIELGTNVRLITSTNLDYYCVVYDQISTVAGLTTRGLYAVAIRKSDYQVSVPIVLDNLTYYDHGFNAYCEGAMIKAYVIWPSGLGVPNTKIAYLGQTYSTFAAPTAVTISGAPSNYGSAIKGLGSDIVFGLCDGSTVKVIAYNDTLSAVTAAIRTIMTKAAALNTQSGVIFSYDSYDANYLQVFTTEFSGYNEKMPFIKRAVITASTTAYTEATLIYGCVLAGNPIRDLQNIDPASNIFGDYYLPVQAQQSADTVGVIDGIYSSYLVRIPDFRFDNNYLSLFEYYIAAKFYDLNTKQPSSALTRQPFFVTYTPLGNSTYAGLIPETAGNASLCTIGFVHNPVFAEIGNNLHVTGGYLGMFDGAEFAEHGFIQQPLAPKLTQAAGSTLPAGTYYYQIIYEWQDAFGQVHQSAPSDPVSIVLATPATIDVLCPTLKFTNKRSQVYIAIYRSTDGRTFYRLPQTGINSQVQSQKKLSSVLVNDNTAVINSQPILYTSGGELSNAAAPACLYITPYKRRLVVVPSEDSNSVWYSKEIVPVSAGAIGVPVQFANEFVLSVDERAGVITGVIQLDDKLVIAKATSISIVTGDGPAPNGLQNDFSTPQLIATDTGVEPGRSMIVMPLGIMFKSPKGYYLLDRSLSVQYVGAPVENLNGLACRSAALVYNRNEVWFSTATIHIVYNYYFNTWSTATFAATHSCIYQNLFTFLVGTQILQETPGVFQRNAEGYSLSLTTGWISFANMQGFQRVYKLLILGTFKTPHTFRVYVSYDFNDTIFQTSSWNLIQPAGSPMQYRIFMARQKCEAIKFKLEDLNQDIVTTAESYSLSNMAFEVGVKRGLYKLPAAQSVG